MECEVVGSNLPPLTLTLTLTRLVQQNQRVSDSPRGELQTFWCPLIPLRLCMHFLRSVGLFDHDVHLTIVVTIWVRISQQLPPNCEQSLLPRSLHL